jgi:ubiquinone/menaquinone biosynthesis C-methylase UbiE
MPETPYVRIRAADPEQRKAIYDEIYNGYLADGAVHSDEISTPGARRRSRIALYRSIVGAGHPALLEIGSGTGDLTCELADLSERVVGIDISDGSLAQARQRALEQRPGRRLEFLKMNAVELHFPDGSFDYAISTSMIEHLHPEDVEIHLREVCRVLQPGGSYLVWCPNRLGHHKDRPFHFSMMSHRELLDRMRAAGFTTFHTPRFKGPPMVSARFKIWMEDFMTALHIKILWSHLGVRNVLLVGTK